MNAENERLNLRIEELEAEKIKQEEAWDQHIQVAIGNAHEILTLEATIQRVRDLPRYMVRGEPVHANLARVHLDPDPDGAVVLSDELDKALEQSDD